MSDPNYITLNSTTGFQIKYAIRMKRFLLILTNFAPLNFKDLVEKHFMIVPGILELDAVGLYTDGSGYIIYLISKNYSETELFAQLDRTFQDFFIDKTI
jgi:hypothetical protein